MRDMVTIMMMPIFSLLILSSCSFSAVLCIPLDQFYPFGRDNGDTLLPKTLDGSSPPIQLDISSFPFFGQDHRIIFVSALLRIFCDLQVVYTAPCLALVLGPRVLA